MQTSSMAGSSFLKYLQILSFILLLLYFGKVLFVPLFFGLLIAIVMYPVGKWLEQHGFGKPAAIAVCLLIITILFAAVVLLLIWQIKVFSAEAPGLLKKMEAQLQQLADWLGANTNIKTTSWDNLYEKFFLSMAGSLQSAAQTVFSTLVTFFLVPVYTALFMYHRKSLAEYIRLLTPQKNRNELNKVMVQVVHTYFNYIKGMVLVYLIVGVLNSIGLFLLGVQHPILYGMLCAVMTIIPYIGIVLSALLPISSVWLDTGNIWYPLAVIILFVFVQYLEANIIFPKIVGTQLHINTLSTLVAIIAGGIIWGVEGMILFIPFVAILKIASDHIEEWKPLNLLLSRT
jgi:predicted PurR-regulated permease PerM